MEELCIKFIYLLYILFYGFQNDLCFISVKIIMKKAPLNKVSKLFSRKNILKFFEEILYSSFDQSDCHIFTNGISNVCFNR